jgi:hypothetical protein
VRGVILEVISIDLIVKSVTLEVVGIGLVVEVVCLRVFDIGLIDSIVLVLIISLLTTKRYFYLRNKKSKTKEYHIRKLHF